MARKQKQWAQGARFRLMFKLGGACIECGSDENLTFDCITPQGDAHHRMDASARMCFYHRQHREGNLQILCKKCNTKKSVNDLLWIETNRPF